MTAPSTSEPLAPQALDDSTLEDEITRPHNDAGWIEIIVFTVLLVAFALIILDQADAKIIFTRHFWLDEYLTSLIVLDKSVVHSMKAVVGGVDTNPPVYHLLLRAFFKVVGGAPETTFRLFSGVCMIGALVMTYAFLRRSFRPAAAAIAVLGLTSHPLVIKQSSEARFYAPLLFAAAAFTYFYCGDPERNKSWFDRIGLVLAAILTCTLHYFGCFVIAAVIAGDWAARGFDRRRFIPAMAGPIATLLMVPIALTQRRGLTIPTWIEPLTFDAFSQLFGVVWDMRPACIVLLAFFVSLAWRVGRSGKTPALNFPASALRPVAGVVGLFLVPLIVLAFSLLVQPSWVSKYAIAGALAVTPLVALFASWTRRVALVVVAAAMITLTFFQVKEFSRIEEARDKSIVNRGKHWAKRGDKQLFVFVARNYAYMIPYGQPKLRGRVVLVDMSDSGVEPPSKYHAYELQMAQKVAQYYPQHRMIKPQEIPMRAFDFVGDGAEFEWLSKAVALRKTADGFYKPATTAPATAPATTAATAPASAARTDAASDPPATTDAP